MITKKEVEKKYLNKICDVEWIDIYGEQRIEVGVFKEKRPSEFLVECHTYGKITSVDNNALVIMQEESRVQGDLTAMPLGVIIKISVLKKR